MGNIVIPQKSIIARALREPNLLAPRIKGCRVTIADKYNDAAVFILPSGGTGKANDLKGNWSGSNANLTHGVDAVGHHFGPTTLGQSGNTLARPLPAATNRTLVTVFKLNNYNALSNTHPIDADRDNGHRYFQLRVGSTGVVGFIVWNGVITVSSSNTVPLDTFTTVIAYVDHDANIIGVNVNGVDSEVSYTNTLTLCDEFFTCGSPRNTAANIFDGHLYLAGAWNRCFTAEERQEIYRNPFGALTKPANDSPFIIGAAAAGGASGTLSTQETGADTSDISGNVLVQGSLSAQESGNDTAAFTGLTGNSGTLSAQETGADTSSITGSVLIRGTIAAQEIGNDSSSITGQVLVSGTLSAQETGADIANFTSSTVVNGSLSAQESGTDSAAITGQVLVSGILSVQEIGSDSANIAGALQITGQLTVSEAGTDTASILGTVAISGTLAAQETGLDTASIIETVVYSGTFVTQESENDTGLFGGFALETGLPLDYAQELAITEILYNACGQIVIYKQAGTIKTIKMIIDNLDELVPAGFSNQATDGDVKGRLQYQDISAPRRGDAVAMKDGNTYVLDSYARRNFAEWDVELRRADG